jgi:hypothetical protein
MTCIYRGAELMMEGVAVEMKIVGWWNGRVRIEMDGFVVECKVKYSTTAGGKRYFGAVG